MGEKKKLIENYVMVDEQMERYRTAMSFEKPTARDVASLKSWVYGNASISKTETRFLSHNQDLMSCSGIQDAGVTLVEPLLEDFVIAFDKFLGHVWVI